MSGTLASVKRNGAALEAVCRTLGCGAAGTLDLEALEAAHGPDLAIAALERRLRCRRCGERNIEVIPAAMRHGPVVF